MNFCIVFFGGNIYYFVNGDVVGFGFYFDFFFVFNSGFIYILFLGIVYFDEMCVFIGFLVFIFVYIFLF